MSGHVKHKYICNPGIVRIVCPRGHLILGDNAYTYPGRQHRSCRICRAVACKAQYDKPITKVVRAIKRSGLDGNRAWRYWQQILDHFGAFCFCCGEDTIEFLTLEHKQKDGCLHRTLRPSMASIYLDVIRSGFDADKYGILCMQCNWATRKGRTCPHQRPLLQLVRSA